MIRITKFKKNLLNYNNDIQEFYVYKVIDGNKVIGTYSVESFLSMADIMAKKRLGDYILRDIKIEEITEEEDKEIQIKSKVADAESDFK